MPYTATVNTPGYLPSSDDGPAVFDTASDAWTYLADARRSQEDEVEFADPAGADIRETNSYYSETVDKLDAYASAGHGPDTVYGATPGYGGSHDLGVAYTVTETETETEGTP